MSETFGIGELKPDQTEAKDQFLQRIDVLVNLLTAWMCKVTHLSPFTVCFRLNFWSCWPCCCCGFAACKSYPRPGPQAGKCWNFAAFLSDTVTKMQEVYGQGNGWSKTCKGRQPDRLFLSRYEILHIALTRSDSDFLHLRNVRYLGHLFFAASFCSGQKSTWNSLYSAVENICWPRASQMKKSLANRSFD